jgi:mono/diheme cytochrome c family protein
MNRTLLSILLSALCLASAIATSLAGAATVEDTDAVAKGRRIYLEGILPDGQPLRGQRADIGAVTGRNAACVACHRPSGLGTVEGTVAIPPISGRALFGGTSDPVVVRQDRRFDTGFSVPHAPYSEAALATAIREGRDPSGKALHALMPRYDLTEAQSQAVSAYLNTLSREWSPGASADSVRIATVIAPGVSPERRQAFLATLTTLLNQININVKSSHRQKMVPAIERRLGSRRRFDLDVWELSGPSATWGEQLEQRQRKNPVLAILSGLSPDEWQPVHDFCESNRVACWLPSVDLVPANADTGRFSLYYSAGIAIEAQVVANKLNARKSGAGRVVQLVSADPVARGGASALLRSLSAAGKPGPMQVEVSGGTGLAEAQKAMAQLNVSDTLMLWLRPADLAGLAALPRTKAQVWVSATLSGGEPLGLPPALRTQAILVQPLEIERVRASNLARFSTWLSAMKIEPVDVRMQSEVYAATRSLVATVHGMLNNLYTDYLIERAESTLSMFEAMQVEEEVRDMMMGPMNRRPLSPTPPTESETQAMAAAAKAQKEHLDEMRKRGGTTVYPRLSLGPGQRFASKGAYLERLDPDGPGILGEPEWVRP